MSNPKVSIILTTHGNAPYLKQAIGSVLAQTFEDWECIIAVDNPVKWEIDWWNFDKRIQVIEYRDVPNVSCRFAYTINSAVELAAKGDYLTYLCHDDLYLPWRLEVMLQHFGATHWNYQGGVLFGHQRLIQCFGSNGAMNDYREIRIGDPENPAGTVDHSSVMHRRECFERVGGWDENAPARYGDAYFWMRLQNAGYKFHCIPEVLDCHRFNRESITWKEDHPNEAKVPAL